MYRLTRPISKCLDIYHHKLMVDTAIALTPEIMPPTNRRVVIGLHGPAGCGKDTIADYLVNHWDFEKVSFAAPLKKAVGVLFDMSPKQMEDRVLKEAPDERWGTSPRQLNQWLGTEIMRKQFDLEFFLKRMDISIGYSDRVVISDCRFENEAEYIKKNWGGVVWKVNSSERVKGLDGETGKHSTEQPLGKDLIDRSIDNNGDLVFTFAQVDNHLCDVLPLP